MKWVLVYRASTTRIRREEIDGDEKDVDARCAKLTLGGVRRVIVHPERDRPYDYVSPKR